MGLIIGIILSVIFVILLVVVFIIFKGKISKLTYSKYDKSEVPGIDNTQDLLPFKDIARNRIDLGNHRQVAILKVEPYNYLIRSKEGKSSFAIRLRRSIDAIPFRTVYFTHTRDMVNDNMLKNLAETIEKTVSDYPEQREYADQYFKYISVINIKNPDTGALRKVKDYYIVVPWEPGEDHNGMSESDLQFEANEGIKHRMITVKEEMGKCGIQSDFLTTEGIISLLISIYRREETNRADLLFDESYLSAMVAGDRETLSIEDNIKLTSILEGALAQIDQDIISNSRVDTKTKDKGVKVMDLLTQIHSKL